MKKLLLSCCVTVILLTAVALAHAAVALPPPTVSCQGGECDGNQIRDYVYDLKNNTTLGNNLTSFSVGILDDPSNITDYLSPTGWDAPTIQLAPSSTQLTDGVFTNHGTVAPGRWTSVTYEITWTAPGGGIPAGGWTNLTFGFNDPKPPVNVTWSSNLVNCNTSYPVAGGVGVYTDGPVHTPVPEPSTIVLLIVGAIGLLACAWRRR